MRRIGRKKRIDVGHAWPRRGLLAGVLAGALGLLAVVAVPGVPSASAQAPVGQGFNLNRSDLRFILQADQDRREPRRRDDGGERPVWRAARACG